MKKILSIISLILMVTVFFSAYQARIYAMDEIKNYVTKKETAEMIGRAILMENFPTTVKLDTELEVTEREDSWRVMKVVKQPEPHDNKGFFWLISGGGVGVIFKKTDCQIVEFIVLD